MALEWIQCVFRQVQSKFWAGNFLIFRRAVALPLIELESRQTSEKIALGLLFLVVPKLNEKKILVKELQPVPQSRFFARREISVAMGNKVEMSAE